MIGRLSQSPWDQTLAALQADVGSLLQAKQRLLSWQYAAPAQLQPTIATMLQNQLGLESELPNAQAAASNLTSGQLGIDTVTNGAAVVSFLARMETHLKAVNDLAAQLGAAALPTASSAISWGTIIGVGAIGLGILWLVRRKG